MFKFFLLAFLVVMAIVAAHAEPEPSGIIGAPGLIAGVPGVVATGAGLGLGLGHGGVLVG